jgi:hypothetical protein
MRTRPIFHSSDAAIRGHVFCSFLALAMQKHLEDLLCKSAIAPEWKALLRDLDRLQHVRNTIAIATGWCAWMLPNRSLNSSATPISPCRHVPSRWRPRSSLHRQNPPASAAAAPDVVPRRREFRRNHPDINQLRKSGVQVGSWDLVAMLCLSSTGAAAHPQGARKPPRTGAGWGRTGVNPNREDTSPPARA